MSSARAHFTQILTQANIADAVILAPFAIPFVSAVLSALLELG